MDKDFDAWFCNLNEKDREKILRKLRKELFRRTMIRTNPTFKFSPNAIKNGIGNLR